VTVDKQNEDTPDYEKANEDTPDYEKANEDTPDYEKANEDTPNYENARPDTPDSDKANVEETKESDVPYDMLSISKEALPSLSKIVITVCPECIFL
jgi:hypothetical protein